MLSPTCSRDDKRYTEKKNKTERARRKKEDIARLRGLVDLTLGLDPRIKRIKQEEKEAREAKKKAKNPAADNKAKLEEEKKLAEEEAKKQEELDLVRVVRSLSVWSPAHCSCVPTVPDCPRRSEEGEDCRCECGEEGPAAAANR